MNSKSFQLLGLTLAIEDCLRMEKARRKNEAFHLQSLEVLGLGTASLGLDCINIEAFIISTKNAHPQTTE